MSNDKAKVRNSIWRHRGRRFATGLNAWIALILAGLLLVMTNYLAYRYYARWDISSKGYYRLSDKTRSMLAGMDGEIDIVAFFPQDDKLFDDIRNLLKAYEYESDRSEKLTLNIQIVDPVRDRAIAMEMAQRYGVRSSHVIVFEAEGRKKYLNARDIDIMVDGQTAGKRGIFRGEEAFSSAILSVSQATNPIIYFLTGHAEHRITDYGNSGYSDLARAMRRDRMELKPLLLPGYSRIPEDCSALVIAGPDKKISPVEIDLLSDYLNKNGRVLLLIDPAVKVGLDKLLGEWGVKLATDVVVDPYFTRTGRELIVAKYEDHPLTRNLAGVSTTFYLPRSVEPIAATSGTSTIQADKPRVFVLAGSSEKGWAEMDLSQNPARFDAGVDRPGPVPVAVAVEKGPVSGIEVEISPTRMVVIGDSDFVSNGGLKEGGGGNEYFFMNVMNWLIERETLMAIPAKAPGILWLDMNRHQRRMTFLAMTVALPAVVALIGLTVWLRRRR